jgi:hypothetical protein
VRDRLFVHQKAYRAVIAALEQTVAELAAEQESPIRSKLA